MKKMNDDEAKRQLRPFVAIGRISRRLGNEIGVRNCEIIMSLYSAWQKQGKNAFHALQVHFSLINAEKQNIQ